MESYADTILKQLPAVSGTADDADWNGLVNEGQAWRRHGDERLREEFLRSEVFDRLPRRESTDTITSQSLAGPLSEVPLDTPLEKLQRKLSSLGTYDSRKEFLSVMAKENEILRRSNPYVPALLVVESHQPDRIWLDATLVYSPLESRELHSEHKAHDLETITKQLEQGKNDGLLYRMRGLGNFDWRAQELKHIEKISQLRQRQDPSLPAIRVVADRGLGGRNDSRYFGAHANLKVDPPGWWKLNSYNMYSEYVSPWTGRRTAGNGDKQFEP